MASSPEPPRTPQSLSDGKKAWLGGLVALSVGLVLAGVNNYVLSPERTVPSHQDAGTPASRPNPPTLSVEQTRRQITVALNQEGDYAVAIDLARGLPAGTSARDEECTRVFDFCIRNAPIGNDSTRDGVLSLVHACWTGIKLRGKLAELDMARIKQR